MACFVQQANRDAKADVQRNGKKHDAPVQLQRLTLSFWCFMRIVF
jgi:hypothetical protein